MLSHMLLCVDEPIGGGHMTTHMFNVFLYYQSFLSSSQLLIHYN